MMHHDASVRSAELKTDLAKLWTCSRESAKICKAMVTETFRPHLACFVLCDLQVLAAKWSVSNYWLLSCFLGIQLEVSGVPLVIIRFWRGFSLCFPNKPAIGVPPWLWKPLNTKSWLKSSRSSISTENQFTKQPQALSVHFAATAMVVLKGPATLLNSEVPVDATALTSDKNPGKNDGKMRWNCDVRQRKNLLRHVRFKDV